MDPVLLSRIQFAVTVGFHFLFPPVTIGMAWIILWMMTRWWRTGQQRWARMARFWIKIFAVSFAIGVASGITMEFQFGTNWARYSTFVGDIFGAPLAIEAIVAFFLESTFLGILLFGWNKVSRGVHWLSALMVAVGSTLSAFWILVANSWQQTPAGFAIAEVAPGVERAVLTDPLAAIFNPSMWPRFFHTLDGCLMTGALFIAGISAWLLLKRRHTEFAETSLKMALVVGFLAAVAQLPLGHWHAVQVAETQPAKLAAIEGLFETQTHAPALIFGIPDAENETVHAKVAIPGLLSLLATGNAAGEVKGLKEWPRDERPPLALTFYPFHLMVVIGMGLIAFTLVGVLLWRTGRLTGSRWWLTLAVAAIPLPFVANELGWITAEVGRQPYVVYPVESIGFAGLRTADAVSPTVPAWEILTSILVFSVIYAVLFLLWLMLIGAIVSKGPETGEGDGPPGEPQSDAGASAAGKEAGA